MSRGCTEFSENIYENFSGSSCMTVGIATLHNKHRFDMITQYKPAPQNGDGRAGRRFGSEPPGARLPSAILCKNRNQFSHIGNRQR